MHRYRIFIFLTELWPTIERKSTRACTVYEHGGHKVIGAAISSIISKTRGKTYAPHQNKNVLAK